jgi:proton glutamate symport protein
MSWYKKLHWQIIIGLILGIAYGMFVAIFSSPLLTQSDFKNFPAFAEKLKQQGDSVSQFVVSNLSENTKKLLSDFDLGTTDPDPLEKAISNDLNELIKGPYFYEKERFAKVSLSPETRQGVSRTLGASQIPQVHRRLLEDSFPKDLIKSRPFLKNFTKNWITPFGDIFLNLLKMIAVPLVFTSLVTGVASLSDTKKLSRIGGRTIIIYIATTTVAVVIGLLVVNNLKPGAGIPEDVKNTLKDAYQSESSSKSQQAQAAQERGPLQPVEDMVPDNVFEAMLENKMLQVVFMALLFGIAVVQLPNRKAKPVTQLFDGLTSAIINVVHIIMLMAPLGVFGLITNTIVELAKDDPGSVVILIGALGYYMVAVIIGLLIQSLIIYPCLLKVFRVPISIRKFFAGIREAQLLAFSTSSSGATLPVTMQVCEENLGVSDEVSSFVLPLGATVNMDGTALYQAVAAVFIAQALGVDLTLSAQITIIITAVLASIGTAAVPSAGIVTLVIILEQISTPEVPLIQGMGLIIGVDRILDMLRTTTNVTGDTAVASVVAASENGFHPPKKAT